MRSNWLMGGAALALLLIGATLGGPMSRDAFEDASTSGTTSVAPNEDKQIARELESLQRRVDGLARTQRSLEGRDGGNTGGQDPAEVNSAISGPPDLEHVAQVEDATEVAFADQLASQPTDHRWSSSAEAAFEAYGDRDDRGVAAIAAECHSTLCRVEVELDGLSAPAFLERVAFDAPWDSAGWWRATGDESLVLYMARPGHDLPAPTL